MIDKEYFRNYYHRRKQGYIDLLGGRCKICNGKENLEFDHIDANNKSFNISKFMNYSKKKVEEELKKCQLLCHSCHLEKTRMNKESIRNRAKGENVASSKLKKSDIVNIRKLREEGLTHQAIADEYNVRRENITAILNGRTWLHV